MTARLEDALARAVGAEGFELAPGGLFCNRDRAATPGARALLREALGEAERAFAAGGGARILDFNLGPEDLASNLLPAEGADPSAYEGIAAPGGGRIFRIDHHHDLPSLAEASTTPLVLGWLRALHARGRRDLLGAFARSRYLADHADADILLANHLARRAEDARYLEAMGERLSGAALRNDYVVLAGRAPFGGDALRIYYACVGIEKAIMTGAIPFSRAQDLLLPALEDWLAGRAPPALAARLDRFERDRRGREEQVLAAIEAWRSEGLLRAHLGGRLVRLDAPRKIDNADFFLYLASRPERAPAPLVQVLSYPSPEAPGRLTYKVRAHGGFDLHPLFARLRARFPEAEWGGRSAAGGSKPAPALDPDALLAEVAAALGAVR